MEDRAGQVHLGCLGVGGGPHKEIRVALLDVLSPLGVVGQETGEYNILRHRTRVRECGSESVGESGSEVVVDKNERGKSSAECYSCCEQNI